MIAHQAFDKNTVEEAVAGFVDSVRQTPEQRNLLVELLPERIDLYTGRSANQTVRMRGYILAAFEDIGLPDAALPYALEELESGHDAYLVAAAAKALRGWASPTGQLVPFLLKAVENIRFSDDALTFDRYLPRWPLSRYTTALVEIFRTLAWLGAHATSALPHLQAMLEERRSEFSGIAIAEIENAVNRIRSGQTETHACCCGTSANHKLTSLSFPVEPKAASTDGIEMEDQDGKVLGYDAFFTGKPSIVVFFYTRCNNPDKCSATITRLAALQRAIADHGLQERLRTAAITYDPEYDLPFRLRAYGENRGVSFSDQNRLLRARTGFQDLSEHFQLGVNFTGATVNRHRIELFILDQQGRAAATFTRLQWNPAEVLDRARALLPGEESGKLN